MQPTKPLHHYKNIGLTFIEETGILSLLNSCGGIRLDENRRDCDLEEMCIAVGLAISKVKDDMAAQSIVMGY